MGVFHKLVNPQFSSPGFFLGSHLTHFVKLNRFFFYFGDKDEASSALPVIFNILRLSGKHTLVLHYKYTHRPTSRRCDAAGAGRRESRGANVKFHSQVQK